MVPKENRVQLPAVKSSLYHEVLVKYIKEKNIQFVFPVISPEHDYYELHADFYASLDVSVITMNKGIYELVNNKLDCFNYLNKAGVPAPKTFVADLSENFYQSLNAIQGPYLLKPIKGASGKDIFTLDSISKVESVVSAFAPNYFLVQEYLAAKEEYTVGVYRSAFSDFEDTMVINRNLQFGLSYKGEIIEHPEIAAYALRVCRCLGTTYSANVQLKLQNGQPFVFEVNPRLSSTTYIRAHFGFNEPEMIIKDILAKGKGLQFNKRKGKFARYWEEFFFEEGNL
jgi:carbamoyl-phosphate synthase large subunit